MRTSITDAQKKMLEDMYDNGMTSKGKGCAELHQLAGERTGLDVQVIIDWIGNAKKKEQGRQYKRTKPAYTRGMTAYNCYVQENKEKFKSISDWSVGWAELSNEEKRKFQLKAKNLEQQPNDPKKQGKLLVSKICSLIEQLADTGAEVCVLGVDGEENVIEMGTRKMLHFLGLNKDFVDQMYLHFQNGTPRTDAKSMTDIKDLRKKAQQHMNKLYSAAVKKESQFPYKKAVNGELVITGFPNDVLPIRPMSGYGREKLVQLLTVTHITVEKLNQALTNQPSFTISSQPPPSVTVSSQHPTSLTVSSQHPPSLTISSQPPQSFTVSSQPPQSVTVSSQHPPSFTVSSQPQPSFTVSRQPQPSFTVSRQPHPSFTVSRQPQPSFTVSRQPQPSFTVSRQPQPSFTVSSSSSQDQESDVTTVTPSWRDVTTISQEEFMAIQEQEHEVVDLPNDFELLADLIPVDLMNEPIVKSEKRKIPELKNSSKKVKEYKYNVARILDKKKEGRKIHYLVHWEGYPECEATWEPKKNIPSWIIKSFEG